MIISSSIVGIVADDLTGANDTALQFKLNGAETNILINTNKTPVKSGIKQTWAVSTESRNISQEKAFEKVKNATQYFIDTVNPDFFYKKIDSTVRGNIAVEVLSMLEVLDWDAAIVMPAFPQENRTTVGGYQLLNGVPIERTEMARDPHSPIYESHLPTLFKNQLGEKLDSLIGTIELKTVMDGAGPILKRISELIESGVRIIVADSVSNTDLEQLALAIQKTNYQILPVGTAAAAKILSNEWFSDTDIKISPVILPKLPKFIVSGSATQITANQIERFEYNQEFKDISLIINLDMQTILNGVSEDLVNQIAQHLNGNNIVLVHTSKLLKNFDGFSDDIIQANMSKSGLANSITDFLSELSRRVLEKQHAILITLGGETSYKCCDAINANQLQLVDEVLPAIALSKNANADQWIVTKSGNLGGVNTLVDIIKYFTNHEIK